MPNATRTVGQWCSKKVTLVSLIDPLNPIGQIGFRYDVMLLSHSDIIRSVRGILVFLSHFGASVVQFSRMIDLHTVREAHRHYRKPVTQQQLKGSTQDNPFPQKKMQNKKQKSRTHYIASHERVYDGHNIKNVCDRAMKDNTI